jgi:flagellar M-ring protein FliF
MGFLNQSVAQVRDLFLSMTPAARITAALLLGIIGVSVAYLFQDYAGGSKEYLLNGETMHPREADRMEAAIAKANLSDYEREGNRIKVPRGQKALYLAAVANDNALPSNLDTLLIDESDSMGMFVDSKTREARMKATRERVLSMMIRQMDGVEDANVVYDIRKSRGFEPELITATVSVRPSSPDSLGARQVNNIRAAICGATAGLDPKDVAILNLADNSQFEFSADVNSEDYKDAYFQTRTTYLREMKGRIADLLRDIPGVRIQVSAELDDTLAAETRSITAPGDPTAISEHIKTSNLDDTQVEDRGRPGPTANGPQRAGAEEAVASNKRTDNTEDRNTQNFVPTQEEVVKRAALTPKHLRAAIAIPSDFIASVWAKRFPDEAAKGPPSADNRKLIEDEYTDNIKKMVALLLPANALEDKQSKVEVTVFQSLTPAAPEPPSTVAQTLAWASGNSGTLIMAALALVSLVMLRGMVKSIPTPATNVVLSMPGVGGAAGGMSGMGADGGYAGGDAGGDEGGEASRPTGRPKLKLKKGASLKNDLTDMVRDDPDAAAAILRSWISSAG